MPKRSAIDALPKAVRDWFAQELVRANFQGYDALVALLNERLADDGIDQRISRSTVHRHGSAIERQIKAVQATSLAAQAIVGADADPTDKVNQALVRMLQARLFEMVTSMGSNDDGELDVAQLTRAVADLARASIATKRFSREAEDLLRQQEREAAARAATSAAAKAGATPEMVAAMRRQMGIELGLKFDGTESDHSNGGQ